VNRHLLPEEIDQLLDGEVGFGTAPLKAHIRTCAECRGELEAARALVRQLEALPHLTPAPAFADSVMSRVQVFVPWHVALLDTIRGLVPRSTGGRAVAWASLGSAAAVLLVATLWVATRLDTVIFGVALALQRLRMAVVGELSDAVASLFGEAAVHALRAAGAAGVLLSLVVILLTAALAAGALRVVATAGRRR
jgi:hypothetical protein